MALTQRGSIDTESDMLPQDPPSWVMRWTAWVLLGAFLFGLFIAIIMRLPEIVHCPFVLVPATGADPIQASHSGIINTVSIAEGDPVKKGTDLFVLRSDDIRTLDVQFRSSVEDLRSHEESLNRSDTAYESQLKIKQEEIEQNRSEVKFRENYARTNRDLVTRMEGLAKKGGMSEVEMVKLRLEQAGSEKDFSVAQRTLQQTTLDLDRMQNEYARVRGEQQAEIEKLKFRIVALKSDLENTKDNLLTIRSPYDGVVISIDQRSVGSVVTQGQVLCQLAREGPQLRARMTFTEAGLPRLGVQQKVRYFFDAFPSQRYGAVSGKLDWISPSAVSSADGQKFMGLGSLDRNMIKVGAKSLPLRVGMKGDAHIIVGSRTMIEYAFEPVRQLRESMGQ